MAGIRDLIADVGTVAKGKVQQGIDFMASKAADAADKVRTASTAGAQAAEVPAPAPAPEPVAPRAAPAAPPADPVAARASLGTPTGAVPPGQQVTLWNPVTGQAHGPVRSFPPPQAAPAQSTYWQRVASGAGMKLDEAGSAMGKVVDAGKGLGAGAVKVAGAIAKRTPMIGNAIEGVNLAGKWTDDNLSRNDAWKETLRSGIRYAGGGIGAAAGGVLGGALSIPTVAGIPVGAAAGGAAGYMGGYNLGDSLATAFLGSEKGGRVVQDMVDKATGTDISVLQAEQDKKNGLKAGVANPASVAAPAKAPTKAEAAAALYPGAKPAQAWDEKSSIPTSNGLRTPAQVVTGTDVPASGYGAFKRTTPGNEGEAKSIGPNPGDSVRAAEVRPVRRGAAAFGGGVAAIANIKAAQAAEHTKFAEREMAAKESASKLAGRKDARESNRRQIENAVRGNKDVQAEIAALDPKGPVKAEDLIKGRTAEVEARADYSMGKHGVDLGDASPAAIRDFHDSEKWRAAVHKDRERLGAKFRDYFGNSQFDSNDSYSYRPAYVDKSGTVYSENGNVIDKRGVGGEFNIFGPNSPIDEDMRAYLRNLPSKEEWARRKGTK